MMGITNTYVVTMALPVMGPKMMHVADDGVVYDGAAGGGHC